LKGNQAPIQKSRGFLFVFCLLCSRQQNEPDTINGNIDDKFVYDQQPNLIESISVDLHGKGNGEYL
jgi:hypothetical protein